MALVFIPSFSPASQMVQCCQGNRFSVCRRFDAYRLQSMQRAPALSDDVKEVAACLATPVVLDDDGWDVMRLNRTRYWLEMARMDEGVRERWVRWRMRVRVRGRR
jgi:hypothetical protein